jgi:hypothetical protein
MKKKGYKLRPHLVPYFGAIVNAVNVEGIDPTQFNIFLKVVDKVIENYRADKALIFFKNSREFFEHHALHYDRTSRLYAKEGDYTFEYIEYLPPPPDTLASIGDMPPLEEDPWAEPPIDTVQQSLPFWMTPAPQPSIEGAAIRFNRTNLIFVTAYDSVALKNTNGVFSLIDNLFVGEEGTFDWTSALLSPDSVYCNLTQYNFNTKKAELKVDLVKLNYIGKTPGMIAGKFEFRSQSRKDSTASSYPRFTSYQGDLAIRGLGGPNLEYTGGFSLQGRKILSTSVNGDLATILVTGDSENKFKARSKEFVFQDSMVLAHQAYMVIYQQNDSITHRSVQLKYDFAKDHVVLLSEKGPMRNTPYSASFFNMDFSASTIRWDLKSDSLNIMQGANSTVPMILESVDYYEPDDFYMLGGVGFSFHPLAVVAIFCIQNNTRQLYTGDVAQRLKLNMVEFQKAI